MADTTPDRNYYIVIRSQGAAFKVRINDLHVYRRSNTDDFSTMLPVNPALKSGQNVMSYEFISVIWPDDPQKEPITGPQEAFYAHIALKAVDLRSREEESITLLDIRYDMETGQIYSPEKTIFGYDRILRTPHMQTTGEITTAPYMFVDGYGPPIASEVLSVPFQLVDGFPPFHWENGQQLRDTPELRAGLRAAYQRVYDTIRREDNQAYFKEVQPLWQHTAQVMGYKDAREFAERARMFEDFGVQGENGSVLAPLDLSADPLGDQLEFMGNGRLVRILPDPVYWWFEEDKSKSWRVPLVFYLTPDGQWKVADIAT